MVTNEKIVQAGRESRPASIPVWDLFVRVFHWSLVGAFALAWYSGGIWDTPHLAAGYSVVALVVLRIVWGFAGSHYARFSEFIRGPRETFVYIRQMLQLRAPRYIGHNPAGAVMVLSLLSVIVVICITGVLMTTDYFWGVRWVDNLHSLASTTAIILVGLHIGGVVFASFEHRENLFLAMLTGRKRSR